ncbi:Multidrug resistance-associated protein 1 [Coemansia sp. S100]|nr:Multidrug resistance-associated protein 1 [Coemansia sp. S100]KAJ2093824.1 Multidrug resistance-associated protein 1 [Coemansia sp. S142-1]
MAVPFLISFTTFLVYSLFDNKSHGPLTARLVFVSLALFSLLRSPLVSFSTAISVIANAKISMNRIHKLLTSDELDLESVTKLERVRRSNHRLSVQGSSGSDNDGFSVQVTDGSFSWSSKDLALLDNIYWILEQSKLA